MLTCDHHSSDFYTDLSNEEHRRKPTVEYSDEPVGYLSRPGEAEWKPAAGRMLVIILDGLSH